MPGLAKEMLFPGASAGLGWQLAGAALSMSLGSVLPAATALPLPHSTAENYGSAQAEIFADCCHKGLGCFEHLRLPIDGNQQLHRVLGPCSS